MSSATSVACKQLTLVSYNDPQLDDEQAENSTELPYPK